MRNLLRVLPLLVFLLTAGSSNAQTVYKTPSGKKYHLGSCSMVKNVSEAITVAKVKEAGLEPCKICKPPETVQGPSGTPHGKKPVTVQCNGITRAGSRCKHQTSIANGYCFQHQEE